MDLSMDVDFLSEALSAVTGISICPQNEPNSLLIGFGSLSSRTLQWASVADAAVSASSDRDPGKCKVLVKLLTGNHFEVEVNQDDYVVQIKNGIEQINGTPVDNQRLWFSGVELQDNQKLSSYKITTEATVLLVLRLKGGSANKFKLNPDDLDPQFNYDFSKMKDIGEKYYRGNMDYLIPYGWKRIGLNVKDKYENNDWLGGTDGNSRTKSIEKEWAVSYHGTAKTFVNPIVDEGFKLAKGKRFRYGRGIYSTPQPFMAENYAKEFHYKGKPYKVMIQNRVNMADTKIEPLPEYNCDYYITADEKNIRPYGLLYKQI